MLNYLESIGVSNMHQQALNTMRRLILKNTIHLTSKGIAGSLLALTSTGYGLEQAVPLTLLSIEQSRRCRAWMMRIANAQIAQGASPRWVHRDCAGFVRFVVAESLREHTLAWQKANGIVQYLPPEVELSTTQQSLRNTWYLPNGEKSAYVNAIGLIQSNARFIAKDLQKSLPGDLLFFDQGDAQHLMLWMGRHVVYHRGSIDPYWHTQVSEKKSQHAIQKRATHDPDLRAVSLTDLLAWHDTRWLPIVENPNFLGVFRLNFLI